MAEGAAIKDKTDHKSSPKDGADNHQPLVSHQEVAAHQSASATAAAQARDANPVVKNGQLDFSSNCYPQESGVAKPNGQKLDTPPAATNPPERVGQAANPGSAEQNLNPGKEVKPEVNNGDGAQAARDLPAKPGDPPAKRSNEITYDRTPEGDKEVQAAKQRLESAEKNIPADRPDLKAAMEKHMDDLEHRIPKATAKQIAGVYDATSDLLENKEGKSPLNGEQRARLATDIMSNAAQQHEIDQGMHNTCNVTTLEETLNRQSPDKAARMVADIGLTGQYKAPDGHIAHLDPQSIKPDAEANIRAAGSANGDRNYASQVFDMGAVNDYWQRQNPPAVYTQTNMRDGQGDTGERLKYLNGQEMRGPDGSPMRQPALGTKAMAEIGQHIGVQGDVIVSTKEFQQSNSDGAAGEHRVQSYQDFEKALAKNPTSIVFLNGKDKLFSGTDDKGGSSEGHVVTVSDYKAGPPAQVYMRNQWGAENNKWVSVQELYNASIPRGSENRIEHAPSVSNNVDRTQVGDNTHGTHADQSGSGNEGGRVHGRSGDSGTGGGTIVNGNERMMNDREFDDWQKQIKKEEPADANTPKAHKGQIDFDTLYKLMPKLEQAKQAKDNDSVTSLQSQIDQLLSAGN